MSNDDVMIRPGGDGPLPVARRSEPGQWALDAMPDEAPKQKWELTPSFLWHVAKKWWRVALPAGLLLSGGVVAVVIYLFEPVYRAVATVEIQAVRPMVLDPLKDDSRTFVNTQVEMLRGSVVRRTLLGDPEVARLPEVLEAPDPDEWIQERLRVQRVGESELYQVSFECSDPHHAAKIADGIVTHYLQFQDAQTQLQTNTLMALLETQLASQKDHVRQVEEKLRTMFKEMPDGTVVRDPAGGMMVLNVNERLQAIHQELVRTQVELDVKTAELQWRKSLKTAGEVPPEVVEREIAKHPDVVRLEEKIATSRKTLASFRDPPLLLKNNLDVLEGQLRDLRERLGREIPTAQAESLARASRDLIATLEARVHELTIQEQELEKQLGVERARMEGQAGQALDREFAQTELLRAKDVAQRIEDRMLKLRIELLPAERPERIKRIERADARPPLLPVEWLPFKQIALFGGIAFLFPFCLLLLLEMRERYIYNAEQVVGESRLPVVGEIAVMPSRPLLQSPASSRRYQKSRLIYEESVESLRTSLALAEGIGEMQVLVVASAVSGEGKTSLASQLAVSWSRGGGEKILLVDCDLRDPELQDVFDIELEPGLTDVLLSKATAKAAIAQWSDDLHILPAGRLHSSPHRLFSNGRFGELLQQLRQDYSRIIIDVAPLLSAGETQRVAKAADGVLLSIMRDVSRADQVRLALERLVLAGARPVGAILNGTPSAHYAYQYGVYQS